MDLSDLGDGVYFIVLETEKRTEMIKISIFLTEVLESSKRFGFTKSGHFQRDRCLFSDRFAFFRNLFGQFEIDLSGFRIRF